MEGSKERKGATEYVVLRLADGDAWTPVGTAAGHTKREAILSVARGVASDSPENDGEEYAAGDYRAVPLRSWSKQPDISIRNERTVVARIAEGTARPPAPVPVG